ncbi:MAG: tRNA pseudouridine(55) synthase TruB [Acidobacteriota bacterium]
MRDGLLLVDKPDGCTSHDVVASCRKILRQKKIGHCGTLDPAATGLLLLTLGRATRLTRFLIRAPKVYEGTLRLGVATDTYDATGEVVSETPVEGVDAERIAREMSTFVGTYLQSPPPYSAKKVQGKKLYELARRGEEVPDTKKEVTIYELEPLGLGADWTPDDDVGFRLACSSGTYARSIAHELGAQLGVGGVLTSLRRTLIGGFQLDAAITLDALRERVDETGAGDIGPPMVAFDAVPLPFGEVVADAQQERRIENGQSVLFHDLEGREGDWVKILNRRHRFIAVGAVVERIGTGNVGVLQPKVVFR